MHFVCQKGNIKVFVFIDASSVHEAALLMYILQDKDWNENPFHESSLVTRIHYECI